MLPKKAEQRLYKPKPYEQMIMGERAPVDVKGSSEEGVLTPEMKLYQYGDR